MSAGPIHWDNRWCLSLSLYTAQWHWPQRLPGLICHWNERPHTCTDLPPLKNLGCTQSLLSLSPCIWPILTWPSVLYSRKCDLSPNRECLQWSAARARYCLVHWRSSYLSPTVRHSFLISHSGNAACFYTFSAPEPFNWKQNAYYEFYLDIKNYSITLKYKLVCYVVMFTTMVLYSKSPLFTCCNQHFDQQCTTAEIGSSPWLFWWFIGGNTLQFNSDVLQLLRVDTIWNHMPFKWHCRIASCFTSMRYTHKLSTPLGNIIKILSNSCPCNVILFVLSQSLRMVWFVPFFEYVFFLFVLCFFDDSYWKFSYR